jgi:hypothetical protein
MEANPVPKKPFKNRGRERIPLMSAMNGGEKRLTDGYKINAIESPLFLKAITFSKN